MKISKVCKKLYLIAQILLVVPQLVFAQNDLLRSYIIIPENSKQINLLSDDGDLNSLPKEVLSEHSNTPSSIFYQFFYPEVDKHN